MEAGCGLVQSVMELTHGMVALCPCEEALQSAAILTDQALQKQVIQNTDKGKISGAVGPLSTLRKQMKHLHDGLKMIFSEAQNEAFEKMLSQRRDAISLGRQAVGVDHFLTELLKQNAKTGLTSEDAKEWAKNLDAQLKLKGCTMPLVIKPFVADLKKHHRNRTK